MTGNPLLLVIVAGIMFAILGGVTLHNILEPEASISVGRLWRR